MIRRSTHFVDPSPASGAGLGWRLALHRFVDPERLRRGGRPVVMIPGFAMNSFILGYHPRGRSIAEHLAAAGLEVWTADLRGMGSSRPIGAGAGRADYGIVDIGLEDVAAVLDGVLARTALEADTVDAIGCSLGATYVFVQAAWGHRAERVARIVNLGGPLRWTAVHPLVKTLSAAPALWQLARVRGTRRLAELGLPLAKRVPGLLHVYLHPAICDLSDTSALCRTVEDPVPRINLEVARWVRRGDLVHAGRNLTEDVARLQTPLLTLVANADGIVPEATVCSAHNVMRQAPRSVVHAGDHRRPMSHADLFISDHAEAQVFTPLARWLTEGEAG